MNVEELTLLDAIKLRPAMYLGRHSLTALYHFLNGYEIGRHEPGVEKPRIIPVGFLDWVAYRLQVDSSSMGYLPMILERIPDETKALQRFFDLLEEFPNRVPKLVATLKPGRHKYFFDIYSRSDDEEIAKTVGGLPKDDASYPIFRKGKKLIRTVYPLPQDLKLVVYTNDPGFFLATDESVKFNFFCESLDCLRFYLGRNPAKKLVIADQQVFDRLLEENIACRKKWLRLRAEARKEDRALLPRTHQPVTGSARSIASSALA
jgi:hypothetical protein